MKEYYFIKLPFKVGAFLYLILYLPIVNSISPFVFYKNTTLSIPYADRKYNIVNILLIGGGIVFDFGLRLKELRETKKMSQGDLAKKINKSKSVISGYENNVKTPPIDVLVNLALIYNVSLDYLLGIDKKEMIYIDDLSERQKNLIHNLLLEFNDNKRKAFSGLSDLQHNILNDLLVEFTSN